MTYEGDQSMPAETRWTRTKRAGGKYYREAKRRLDPASKTEFFLDLLNIAALAVQVVTAAMIAWSRTAGTVLAISIGYSTLHRIFLKGRFNKAKWKNEQRRRAEAISVALERLSDCIKSGRVEAGDLDHIEHCVLDVILSEVETIISDVEGAYVNANILIEDRHDQTMLFCLNRANPHRQLHKRYLKEQMLTWRAMNERRTIYEPNFLPVDTSVPYRSILVMPILDEDGPGGVLGALSIDSEIENHFEGRESEIAMRLLPYVTFVKVALVCRQKYAAWPEPRFRTTSAGGTAVASPSGDETEGRNAAR